MTILSDRVDALEATNATLVNILNGLTGTLQAAVDAGQGPQGWSPVVTVQADGNRSVYQITDWIGGGTGATKPAVGSYLGSTGFVATAAEAIDVRGAVGLAGQSAYQEWEAIPANNGQTFNQFIDYLSVQAVTATAANVAAAQLAQAGAETAEGNALGHATQTGQDRAAVENLFDTLDDRFLGGKASNPPTDNDGDPLIAGARYWNTSVGEGRVYNGSDWEAPSTSASSSAQQALQHKTDAQTAKGEAETAEDNAKTSEGKAQNWAEEVEDVEVEAGKFSASHHAAKAELWANMAALAANATTWVSEGTYVVDQNVWSPLDNALYHGLTAHTDVTTDPSLDALNWAPANGGPHTHEIDDTTGLQAALDGKATSAQGAKADTALQPGDASSDGEDIFLTAALFGS